MNTDITQHIPHRGQMILIDNIIDKSEDNFTVEVLSSSSSLLSTSKGIPAYCCVEYMAQTISAYNNIYAMSGVPAKEPQIGFILAIRKFKCEIDYLPVDSRFIIKVTPILIVNNSGSFECSMELEGRVIATGKITAYEPSAEELIKFQEE